jgi:hypothetical protein
MLSNVHTVLLWEYFMLDMLIVAANWSIGGAAFPFAVVAFTMAWRNHYRIEKMQRVLSELELIVKRPD